jgi:4-amino-4-deoxy-L-arabinose transferase-like glycosyltransferase
MMKQAPLRQLALVLALALTIRLAAGWAWQSRLDGRFAFGDSESYWTLAKAIAAGTPYEYGEHHARIFRTPGYPILLAPILQAGGDGQLALLWARAEAAFLGTLAVAGVWWLARILFDDPAALLAGILAALYPGAIVLSTLILSEAPFCPLMLLQLALWSLACRVQENRRTPAYAFCAGLAAGAATLMRPSWLLFTPLAAAVAVLGQRQRDSHLRIALWMLLGLLLAMLPWWIRNACLTGRFVPTTLQVGASLYDGLNPEATGASNMDFVARFTAVQEQENASEDDARVAGRPFGCETSESTQFELRLDRRLRDEALGWAMANPARTLHLAAIKFLRMWNIWPNERRLSSWPIRLAVFFTYTPLLLLAIIGAWRTLGRGWPYILCWLPAIYLTMLHIIFVSSIRYREPAMLPLLALVAGIGNWKLGIRREDSSNLTPADSHSPIPTP